ncbi:carboxypeptidase N subunit 2-like isoform X2 [Oppia nitens]|uniref:carboxypeptidase N subunit 2-like isoform X2 n=1 Tax=Oppia nitens TaxID=1686743 RepID=UPI0023DA2F43|nr:carboxypeptidase N subunit 2-like isoform X2 [Oppia nitens]
MIGRAATVPTLPKYNTNHIESIDSVNSSDDRKALPLIANETNGCHVLGRESQCSCYPLDDAFLIDCKITSYKEIRDDLKLLISLPIKSFSVHSINESLDALPDKLFDNFSTIEQMYISLSSLVNVSVESFEGLETSLKTLSLVNSKLKRIPKTALSILKSLTALDLGSNKIEEVDAYAFYGLPLVSLNLQSNEINSLLEFSLRGLEKTLIELVLTNNLIDRFPLQAIRRLKALVSLKLQSNRITELPDDGSTRLLSLRSLDLHSNRIKRLDSLSFKTTPKLVSLSVANNRLTDLSDSSIFGHLLDLETLDLSFNELTGIDLNNMKALRSIDLSNNELKSMALLNLIGIREVFVSHNKLSKLTNKTFVNCSSLSVVFMQHNSIESIEMNTFDTLQYLLTLDLSFNQLKAIDSQLFKHNTQLQSLYLDNNPFHCDCRLLSIYEWLETHSRLLALDDRQDMLCSEPQSLKHNSLLSLSVGDFCPVPIISVMKISKLDSTQVSIKWEVHNDTLVDGFTLEHYSNLANNITPMALKLLGPSQRQLDIRDLMPENWYMFCVQANGKYHTQDIHSSMKPMLINVNHLNASQYFAANRKCSQVRTLSKRDVISLSTIQIIASIVVLVVIILMITVCVLVIVYKYRSKKRRPLKSQVPDPEEFITYRHFSLPSSENVYS